MYRHSWRHSATGQQDRGRYGSESPVKGRRWTHAGVSHLLMHSTEFTIVKHMLSLTSMIERVMQPLLSIDWHYGIIESCMQS